VSAKLSATSSAGARKSSEGLDLITQGNSRNLRKIRGLDRQILPQEPYQKLLIVSVAEHLRQAAC
jgi:hypothetical protein